MFGAEMPPFQVYTPDGSWLGSVAVAPGLGLERRVRFGLGRTFEIGDDYVLSQDVPLRDRRRPTTGPAAGGGEGERAELHGRYGAGS